MTRALKISGLLTGAALSAVLIATPVMAWANGSDAYDSADIETILVSAAPNADAHSIAETQHRLDPLDLDRLVPVTAGDLIARLPSAQVAANSRGQTLATLRGAGERQVAIFYDGALLNVPWDNRFDVAALPAGAVGGVETATGTLSPQYGVNALGAISLSPPDTEASGGISGRLFTGNDGQIGGDIDARITLGDTRLLVTGGAFRRDALSLASGADLPFHQPPTRDRLNTDREQANVLLRAERDFGTLGSLSATLLYADAEHGVAPESDRADARFWRLPELRTAMAIVRGHLTPSETITLFVTGWVQDFAQTITSFSDATYSVLEDSQKDDDLTFGLRAQGGWVQGPLSLVASANIIRSRHNQLDTDFTGPLPSKTDSSFAQNLISIGLDAAYSLTETISLEAALGLDRADYTDTGPFDPPGRFDEPVFRLGAAWQAAPNLQLRAAIGQKARVPTLRDLFGTAINRFLVNPELQAETIRSAELGGEWLGERVQLSLTGFHQNVDDTIDQIRIGPLRQRVNLAGSTIWGIESAGSLFLTPSLTLAGNATYTRIRRQDPAPGEPRTIAERPELLARLSLDYHQPGGARAGVEGIFTGRAFSPDDDGVFQALPRSLQINLHAAYPIRLGGLDHFEVFVRADNITDSLVIPQAGLPAPGRTVRLGLTARL